MAYKYDEENIFAKILRGEIPNETILENDHALAGLKKYISVDMSLLIQKLLD